MLIAMKTKGRRGATAVELAAVIVVFTMIMFGILEYCLIVYSQNIVENAAREGARYAVVNTTTDTTAGVQAYVNNYLAGQGASQFVGYSPSSNITVYMADPVTGLNTGSSWLNTGWGNSIGVSVTGTYQPVVPGMYFLTGSLTVTGTCVMTIEAN